jgi:hypothetical protein
MDWVFPFIGGWCGGIIIIVIIFIPFPFPRPRPWDDCLACGGLAGVLGAIGLEFVLNPRIQEIGLGERLFFDVLAGMAAASIARSIVNIASKGQMDH